MGLIPGYRAQVYRNGQSLPFLSFSITREADKLVPSFEIELAGVVTDLSPLDTWSAVLGFGGFSGQRLPPTQPTGYRTNHRVNDSVVTVYGDIPDSDGESDSDPLRDERAAAEEEAQEGDGEDEPTPEEIAVSELLEYCVPKTIVFINYDWLRTLWPTAQLVDGVPYEVFTQYANIKFSNRIQHNRLPGKEVDAKNLHCVMDCRTHRQIATWLCQQVGLGFSSNVPDIDLIDTCTVTSGTTWFDAIKQNFVMWGADMTVRDGVFYVEDHIATEDPIPPDGDDNDDATDEAIDDAKEPDENSTAKKPSDKKSGTGQHVMIDVEAMVALSQGASKSNDAKSGASVSGGAGGAGGAGGGTSTRAPVAKPNVRILPKSQRSQIIDHVIVTGRRTEKTDTLTMYSEPPDYTPIELPEVQYDVSMTVTTSVSQEKLSNSKVFDEYTGEYGPPENRIQVAHVQTQIQDTAYHVERDPFSRKYTYLPITETTRTITDDGIERAKTEIEYAYGPGHKVIRTTERQHVYTALPGSTAKDLRLVRVKVTKQDEFVKPLNTALTSEVIQDKVLYYELKDNQNNTYRDDLRPLVEAARSDSSRSIIDTDSATKQKVMEMSTHWRRTFISRVSQELLVKRDLDYDVLSGAQRMTSQILENPERDVADQNEKKDEAFRAEFFDGPGRSIGLWGRCYHPPTTVHHDDIDSDYIAWEIARRIFARKGAEQEPERPEHEPDKPYKRGDIVAKNGRKYQCKKDHTAVESNTPPDGAQWQTYWSSIAEEDNFEVQITCPVPLPVITNNMSVVVPPVTRMINGQLRTVPGGKYVVKSSTERITPDSYEITINARKKL